MSTARAWKRVIEQLEEYHNLVGDYKQCLADKRGWHPKVTSIIALSEKIRVRLNELAAVRCRPEESKHIICERKVSQPVLRC
jgi:hypothetical protein